MNLLALGLGVFAVAKMIEHQETVNRSAYAYRSTIADAAARYNINPAILAGVLYVESSFNPRAVGSVGEVGMAQFKQIALDDIVLNHGFELATKVDELYDPTKAIYAAAALLDLNRQRSGSMYASIRAYNVGIGAAQRNTDAGASYLAKVLQASVSDYVYTLFSDNGHTHAGA